MQTVTGLAMRERHAQRREREHLIEPRAQRPANDAAQGEIENHGEIELALVRRNVGDVRRPDAIPLPQGGIGLEREAAIEHVRRSRLSRVAARGHPILGCAHRADARAAHEPGDAVFPHTRCPAR